MKATKTTQQLLVGAFIAMGSFVCSAQMPPSGAGNSIETVGAATGPSAGPPPHGIFVSSGEIMSYLFFIVPILIMMFFIARRKGQPFLPYFLLGLIPFFNIFAMLWLLSYTDASIKLLLEEIKNRLNGNA